MGGVKGGLDVDRRIRGMDGGDLSTGKVGPKGFGPVGFHLDR